MNGKRLGLLVLAAILGLPAFAQKHSKDPLATESATGLTNEPRQFVTVEQPDADQTKREFQDLMNKYPPNLRAVFKEDPSLMSQEQYLTTYPALANYLQKHPDIAQNPAFYLDGLAGANGRLDNRQNPYDSPWGNFVRDLSAFLGFGMAIGLLTWLIRTFIDYRRWNHLAKVQQEVHSKLLDRFGNNEELMAFISTPAGSKFLQEAPITLEVGAGTRAMAAPLSRILWSIQAGLVLAAAGGGFMIASSRMTEDMYLPTEVMGIVAAALGVGFVVSAGVSYVLSWKLGLLDRAETKRTAGFPEA